MLEFLTLKNLTQQLTQNGGLTANKLILDKYLQNPSSRFT